MLASELVKKLQERIEEFGDLPVTVFDDCNTCDYWELRFVNVGETENARLLEGGEEFSRGKFAMVMEVSTHQDDNLW